MNLSTACDPGQFPCKGRCLSLLSLCDMRVDCEDGSDEDLKVCLEHCKGDGFWMCPRSKEKSSFSTILESTQQSGEYLAKRANPPYLKTVMPTAPEKALFFHTLKWFPWFLMIFWNFFVLFTKLC